MASLSLTKELSAILSDFRVNREARSDYELFQMIDLAILADQSDHFLGLSAFKDEFYFPKTEKGEKSLYFCGHSLGLQPKQTRRYVEKELMKWEKYGVEGHFIGESTEESDDWPWRAKGEEGLQKMASLIGAKPRETVIMNSLSVNLHLMMQSFYRPTAKRFKILVEEKLFPSDYIAVRTQLEQHGFDSKAGIIHAKARKNPSGKDFILTEDLMSLIEVNKDELALVMLSGVQYYTGQAFELDKISKYICELNKSNSDKEKIMFGVDLAHAVGNLDLKLHDWGIDFGVWCSYKYLNSGPGGIGGAFVHEKHFDYFTNPSNEIGEQGKLLGGWWGHRSSDRFEMKEAFIPTKSALAWQLSNPPILLLASLYSSLDVFTRAGGMEVLRRKSMSLTRYLEILIELKIINNPDYVNKLSLIVLTPGFDRFNERGSHLSLKFNFADSNLTAEMIYKLVENAGAIADVRKPDVIRIAPCALYNSFEDVFRLVDILKLSIDRLLGIGSTI